MISHILLRKGIEGMFIKNVENRWEFR